MPVYFNSAALQKQLVIAKRRQNTASFTGVAQRQRAGLITPRTQDQSLSPVYFNSAALQKQPVIAKRRQNTVSFTAVAQRLARRFTLWAHNSEVTRSKRVAGIPSLRQLCRSWPSWLSDVKTQQHTSPAWRSGSAPCHFGGS